MFGVFKGLIKLNIQETNPELVVMFLFLGPYVLYLSLISDHKGLWVVIQDVQFITL